MPVYRVEIPGKGKFRIDSPEDLSDEQAYQAALTLAPPETTIGGYARDALKAVPRGLVGGLESAALGAAALLPGDTQEGFEKTAREGIKGFAERLKPRAAAGYEESPLVKVMEGVGSMGSLLIPGGIGGMAARGAGLAAGIGRTAAAGSTAAGMGAGEARERAVEAGATPEQITSATQLGVIPGIAELAPVERIFRMMPKELKGGIFDRLQRALVTGGMEGLQEGASAIAQNLIAQQVYKPSQELIEKVGENAAYGAGAGAIVQFLVDAVAGRRAKPTPAAGKPSEEPPGGAEAAAISPEKPVFYGTPEGTVLRTQDELDARAKYAQQQFEEENLQRQQMELFPTQIPAPRQDVVELGEERPEFELTGEQQMELPLEEPAQPSQEPTTSKVTDSTLLSLGFKPGVIKTAKVAKELKGLDLTNPDDINRFEELVTDYGNRSSAKQPYNATAVKRFIEQAKFRTAQQTSFDFGEVPQNATGQGTSGAGDVSPVSQRGTGVGATDGTEPGTVGGAGPVAGEPVSGAQAEQRTLSDAEEVETALDIAAAAKSQTDAKSKKDFNDAITYLVYFANDPDVGPTAKLAARAALKKLDVPEAEVQAVWGNIAISHAAQQQEQSENASLEASKKTQRNIGDQLKRELNKTPRKPRAKTEQQLVEAQAQKTAFEQSEELKRLREWQTLEMPLELSWVTTPADTRRLMQSYFDDYNAQQEATKREVEEKGTKRRLSAAERKKLRENEQLEALGMSKETVADIYKLGKRATPPKFTAIKLGVNDVDPKAMAEIDSLMEQARKTDAPAARKSLRDTAYRQMFAAIRDTKNRVVTQQSTSEFDKLMRRGGNFGLSHRPIGSGLSKEVRGLLDKGDLKGALKLLGETGSTPIIRTAARKILSAIKGTKVLVRKTPTGDAGIYSSITDTIYIDPEGLHEHTLLHEAMHAAVSHVLANPNHVLTQKLQKLFDSLAPELKGQYGATNLQEFAAEAISNQEFQDALRGQPKGWWGRFVDAVRGFLGLSKAKQVEQTLDQLLEAAPSEARQGNVGVLKLPATAAMEAQATRRIAEKTREGDQGFFTHAWRFAFDEAYRVNKIKELRNAVIFNGASVEEKLLQANDLKSVVNLLLATRSMDLATSSILEGAIALDPETGLFKINQGVSLADVYSHVNAISEKAGVDMATAKAWFDLGATVLRLRSPEISPEIRKSMALSAADEQAADDVLRLYGDEIRAGVQKFQQYKNQLLQVGKATGRFTQEDVDEWVKAPEYVPWHRILDDAKFGYETKKSTKTYFKGLVDNGKVAELIGGDVNKRPIGDILGNMENLSFWLVNTIVRNHAANVAMDGLLAIKSAETLKTPQQGTAERLVKTYRDGKAAYFEVEDPLDRHAFMGVESISTPLFKSLGKAANWLRTGTTLMPGFVVSQLFQDGFRATALSGAQSPFMVGAKVLGSFKDALTHSGTALDLAAYGIIGRPDFMAGTDRSRIEAALDAGGTGVKKSQRAVARALEAMSRASDASQRMAIYEQTLKETGDKMLALYKASEIINFQRQGRSGSINVLRQIIPFMNAYLQGMDVTYRSMLREGISGKDRTTAIRQFWATGMKIAALSSIYAMLVSDDEDYKKLPDHEKLTGFMIPGSREMIKELTGTDIGGNLKIPTPQDPIGLMFKTIPEQSWGYIMRLGTKDEVDATKLARVFRDGLVNAVSAPGYMPQLLKPGVEVAANYSFFTGNPIIGKGLEGRSKDLQFTSGTSELSKLLSAVTPLAPVQVEHLVRGYLGIFGGTVMYAGGRAIEGVSGIERADRRWADVPQATTFLTGSAPSGLKDDYYELREKSRAVAEDIKFLMERDPEEAKQRLMENKELYALAKSGFFSQVEQKLSQLRQARRLIEGNKDMNSEEKRAKLDQIDKYEMLLFSNLNLPTLRKQMGM